ncbi:hypothetical protein, partial [Hoylesella loescheii]|uniref:hypothetical protein n=1 Tax=Hoylesella loescheii TaxID=840 RepID=UPI0028EBA442
MINRTLLFLTGFLMSITLSSSAQKKAQTTVASKKATTSLIVGQTYKGINLIIADPQFASTIVSCKRASIKFDVIATFLSTTKVKYNFIVRLETNDKEHVSQEMLDASIEAIESIKKELEKPRIETYRIVNGKVYLGNSKKHCFIIRSNRLLYMDDTIFKGELHLNDNNATTAHPKLQNKINDTNPSIYNTIIGHIFNVSSTNSEQSKLCING